MNKEIEINKQKYKVLEDSRNALDVDAIKEKMTDYFDSFDYIVGDWAYGKLRLKGFNDKSNNNYKPINDFSQVSHYIEDYCAYGCKYFVIEKIKD